MTHKRAKQEALKLFEKNFSAPDAAASLRVNLRTVQRWFKEFDGGNVATSEPQKSCESISLPATEDSQPLNAQHDQNVLDDWFNFATKLSSNHFYTHNRIRIKLEEIISQKLNEPEINLRAVHTLSIALTRYMEGERVAAMLHGLDINVAAQRLNAAGYIVMEGEVET